MLQNEYNIWSKEGQRRLEVESAHISRFAEDQAVKSGSQRGLQAMMEGLNTIIIRQIRKENR